MLLGGRSVAVLGTVWVRIDAWSSAVELLHHELPAGLVTQEQSAVSREGAHHGGGEARVERPHAWTQENGIITVRNLGLLPFFLLLPYLQCERWS